MGGVGLGIIYQERFSDSPFVERVWHSRSQEIDTFISVAIPQLDFVFWRENGKDFASIRGPETHASRAPVPENSEFFGIVFKPGVYLPNFSALCLTDSSLDLPDASGRSFWLNSRAWQFPVYDNVDTFVDQLAKQGVLAYEPAVETVLQGGPSEMSLRSLQRRFLNATGLTYRTMQQIERARRAAILLRQGNSIVDTALETGYYDQAYLTKSLKLFIGQTPGQLVEKAQSEQLSLLYKTDSFVLPYDEDIEYERPK